MKKILIGLVALLSMSFANVSWSTPITWANNGHQYQVFGASAISWNDARSSAQALGAGWDLVTITSLDEQNFISNLLGTPPGSGITEYAIGGQYLNGAWEWVTGEAFNFTYWGNGEPNGNANEPFLAMDNRMNTPNWGWNDYPGGNESYIIGYIAEQSNVPEPSIIALMGVGLFGISFIRRKIRK